MDGHIIVMWLYKWRNILGSERENSNVGLNSNYVSTSTTLSGTSWLLPFSWGKDLEQGHCHCIFGTSQPNGVIVFAVVLGEYIDNRNTCWKYMEYKKPHHYLAFRNMKVKCTVFSTVVQGNIIILNSWSQACQCSTKKYKHWVVKPLDIPWHCSLL